MAVRMEPDPLVSTVSFRKTIQKILATMNTTTIMIDLIVNLSNFSNPLKQTITKQNQGSMKQLFDLNSIDFNQKSVKNLQKTRTLW